jgi:uncharacterized protein YecE (DUF72 family)
MKILVGTSGYAYKHWRNQVFYPSETNQKDELEYYSKYFNTVEINATFYGSFKKSVFENWASKTPENFVFSIKGPRFITHIKKIKNVNVEVTRFYESAEGLGKKLGVVLWQFPRSFKISEDNFKKLNDFLYSQPLKIKQAIELRDESWFKVELFDLLRKYNAAFVINNSGKLNIFEKITSDFTYLRFHGPKNLYTSDYSEEELSNWAIKIKSYKVGEVFCYFNNDSRGYAVKNARYLKRTFEG